MRGDTGTTWRRRGTMRVPVRWAVVLLVALAAFWMLRTASPTGAAASVQNLHAADVTVGGSVVYNTVNTGAVAGTLATATAPMTDRNIVYNFADSASISLWVSDPVPATEQWAIGGAWSFGPRIRTSSAVRGYVRARLYRVNADGSTALLATTGFSSRIDFTTSYQAVNFNYTLAANTLTAGQRFGVEFQLQPDNDFPGVTATLGFDSSTAPSTITAQIAVTSVPGAPTAVTATAGNTQATVQWTAPASNGGSAILSYTVTSSPGGFTATTPNGTTTNATVTGLTNGTAYTFTVVATNAIGGGPASAPSNSVTPAGLPGAPTAVVASPGNTQATVQWTAPASDGGSAITGYQVTSSPGGFTASTPDGATLTATVTGLTNGTAYTFTVKALNGIGLGPASAASNSVTPVAGAVPPGKPTSVIASGGNAQATVTWVAPASNGGAEITSYTVTSSPEGLTATTPDGITLEAIVTGLTNGTAYTFTVTATNSAGTGLASDPSAPVTPATVPGAPTAVLATAGNTQATVEWTAPASDGGSPITSYIVTSSPGGFTATTPDGATLNAIVVGLTNGTAYTFTVKAVNTIGQSAASAPSAAVTPNNNPTPPTAPRNPVATAGNTLAVVMWTAPLSDGGSPILNYTVTSSPGGLTATTADASTNTVVTGLTNGVPYTFTVRATNAIGNSPASVPSNAVTPAPPTVPGAPQTPVASAGNTQATVTWAAPASDGGSGITGYTVTSNPGAITATVSGSTLEAIVLGLTNGTPYTFTVKATNAIGTGPASVPSNSVTPGIQPSYLHAENLILGPGPYNTVNQTGVAGGQDTITAPLAAAGIDLIFSDAEGLAAFVSDAVPATKQWAVGGIWTFDVYASATASTTYTLRARISRVTTAGSLVTLQTTSLTPPISATTAYQLVTWTTALPTTTLYAGERYAVEFLAQTSTAGSTFARIGFDASATPSAVRAPVVESNVPGQLRSSHFRIGKDFPLSAMDWFGTVDTAVTNFTDGQAFRVRMQVYNDGTDPKVWTPRLDYSTSVDSGYAIVPVASGAPPFYIYNSSVANAGPIATTEFGLGTGPGIAQAGIYYDTVNPAGGTFTLNAGSYTEVEFSVYAKTTATEGTTYFFRITNNGEFFATDDAGPAKIVTSYPWPPLPAVSPPAHNFHQQYSADTSACAACHRAHTGPAPTVLYKRWPEEQVCFTCHDGSAAPNIQAQFAKTYKMPITGTSGVHSKDERRNKDPLSFRLANRHVECADCHDPHLAGAGNHTLGTNYTAGPQQGAWGLTVSNNAPWTAPTFGTTNPTTAPLTFQYQLCFKCHSSWAYGATPPTSPSGGFPETDQAKEFNTLNPSYHPVEDVGKNPFLTAGGTSYASSLINGLTPTSRITCSDCHASETTGDPAGPHGSQNPFILRGRWDRTTGQSGTSDHLCFKCHAWSTYGPGSGGGTGVTGFSGEKGNLHGKMVGARNKANSDAPIVCQDCHVAIVHGYHRDHLLGFTGDGQPYVNRPYSGGLVIIDQWRASGQWVFDSCGTAMNSCK